MYASSIAKRLNAMQIMTPGDFKIRDGCKSFITHDRNSSKLHAWTTTTIATILKNEVYIGNMVQGPMKANGPSWRVRTRQSSQTNNLRSYTNGLPAGPESRREKRMCIRFPGLYRAARAGIA